MFISFENCKEYDVHTFHDWLDNLSEHERDGLSSLSKQETEKQTIIRFAQAVAIIEGHTQEFTPMELDHLYDAFILGFNLYNKRTTENNKEQEKIRLLQITPPYASQ